MNPGKSMRKTKTSGAGISLDSLTAIRSFRPSMIVAFAETYVFLNDAPMGNYNLSSINLWFNAGDAGHEAIIRPLVAKAEAKAAETKLLKRFNEKSQADRKVELDAILFSKPAMPSGGIGSSPMVTPNREAIIPLPKRIFANPRKIGLLLRSRPGPTPSI
jgi:hypothetical protein